MLDCTLPMKIYQKQLDDAGIKYDITLMCGATQSEIEQVVSALIRAKRINALSKKVWTALNATKSAVVAVNANQNHNVSFAVTK